MLKYLSETDMDSVLNNTKTGFSKLDLGFWKDAKEGDIITMVDEKGREVDIKITSTRRFQNFKECGDSSESTTFPENHIGPYNFVAVEFELSL